VPESVDVIIGYYGDKEVWGPLAASARKSALEQTVQPYTVYTTYRPRGESGSQRWGCSISCGLVDLL